MAKSKSKSKALAIAALAVGSRFPTGTCPIPARRQLPLSILHQKINQDQNQKPCPSLLPPLVHGFQPEPAPSPPADSSCCQFYIKKSIKIKIKALSIAATAVGSRFPTGTCPVPARRQLPLSIALAVIIKISIEMKIKSPVRRWYRRWFSVSNRILPRPRLPTAPAVNCPSRNNQNINRNENQKPCPSLLPPLVHGFQPDPAPSPPADSSCCQFYIKKSIKIKIKSPVRRCYRRWFPVSNRNLPRPRPPTAPAVNPP